MGIAPAVLQRRHVEVGRIRLGDKGDRGQPRKLTRFRFTSPRRELIADVAALYGGEVSEWTNGGNQEWEVYSEATSIPVVVLKGGVSQWLETWQGGGCVHRCDGEVMQLPDAGRPCSEDRTTVKIKDANRREVTVPAHDAAKPYTRVTMMLAELESLGGWRLESHGWNAAAEIPAIAELAAYVGDLVPANLHLVPRRSVSNGQTRQYVVPVLDLRIGTARLRELVNERSGLVPELGSGTGERRALPSPMTEGNGTPSAAASTPAVEGPDPYAEDLAEVRAAQSRDQLTGIWSAMVARHLVGTSSTASPQRDAFIAAWRARAQEVPEHTPEPDGDAPPSPEPDADGIVDAEIVESADDAWQALVQADHGMSLGDLEDGFAAWADGNLAADATAAQINAYAAFLKGDQGSTYASVTS